MTFAERKIFLHGNLEKVLTDSARSLIYDVVKEKAVGYDITDESCQFIADFYKYSFAGIVLNWIERGMTISSDELVGYIAKIMHGNLEDAIRKFAK